MKDPEFFLPQLQIDAELKVVEDKSAKAAVEAELRLPDPSPEKAEEAFSSAKLAEHCTSCGRQRPDVVNRFCQSCRERFGCDNVRQNA